MLLRLSRQSFLTGVSIFRSIYSKFNGSCKKNKLVLVVMKLFFGGTHTHYCLTNSPFCITMSTIIVYNQI
jgi:hypothetical protein